MNICPITYEPCGNKKYSAKGLRLLSPKLKKLNDLSLTQEEQLKEAAARAVKMSIQGVQPKLSAKLRIKEERFEIVDRNGVYILKPQNNFYPELPENEDLSMRLAKLIGIEIPLHGLVYSIDGRFTYFIKRFDRYGKNKKLSLEDFAQLAGKSRETKYDFSMEKIIPLLERNCTFPLLEKIKLFRLTLFNYLIGNEDMHLKNYSIISRNNKIELSPAYDLLNTTIATKNVTEEIALPISGKKSNLTPKVLIKYWGKERLQLNENVISQIIEEIKKVQSKWEELIKISFLSNPMKEKYMDLLNSRRTKLNI
ncbi:MAG TPA: type II toxin-antitoxin system HipA family toxin [Ignavibacteria bacterium]|nr:type II toxin-antitoxin system HipA family toxin [Ignavibacteria bacterium]